MNRLIAILMALLLLLAPAALAEAEQPNPAAGIWYAMLNGVPFTLTLNEDGSYVAAFPAAFGEPVSGAWALDDGYIRLDDGSLLDLVDETLLVWAKAGFVFTREPLETYAPADLMDAAALELYAGYWECVFVDLGDAVVPAGAVNESTDLYIDGESVALGGPRFGDIFWTFDFEGGALSADVNGQTVALALQQDDLLRLTLEDEGETHILYLMRVVTAEAKDE